MTQNVVTRCGMKVDIGKHEIHQIIMPIEFEALGAKFKNDMPRFSAIELFCFEVF
jgi:hypothetical protein